MSNPPLFIDIYRGDPVLDFAQTKASGIIGVIHKATEGTAYVDRLYAHRRKWWMDGTTATLKITAIDQQIKPLWGAYHFFHGGNPHVEADHFLAVAEPDDDTCLVLDWEKPPGLSSATRAQAEAFIQRVEEKTVRSVIIYSGNVVKERITGHDAFFAARRLWLAQYGTRWVVQRSWDYPWAWQNNGDQYGPGPHRIPGIKGLCDNSTIVRGPVHDFIESWSGRLVASVEVPLPTDSVVGAKAKLLTGITATEFGGKGDRQRSAYGGPVDGDKPGVALPFHFVGARPQVRVHHQGKEVDCEIVDVGPHAVDDPYWFRGTRPWAEGRGGNKAGIDLTTGAMNELGVQGAESTRTITIDWEFI